MSQVGRQNIGLIAAVVVILLIGGFVAFSLGARPRPGRTPSLITSSSASGFTHSLSNAKQLTLANLMYAADWDDRFPPAMDDFNKWQTATMPYLSNTSVFYTANPRGAHFEGNPDVSAAPLVELNTPDRSVMLYEDKEWPDGNRIIGYTDGHAKGVQGFDMATGLVVDMTPKGRALAEASRKAILAPKPKADKKNPLGMPGD